MVEGFTRLTGLHFLPEDRPAVDKALVAGRTVVEVGDSAIGRGLAPVVDALAPDDRRRRADRRAAQAAPESADGREQRARGHADRVRQAVEEAAAQEARPAQRPQRLRR